jgi:subtilisin family serine protease
VEASTDNADTLSELESVATVWKSTKLSLDASTINPQSFSDDAAAPKYSVHETTGVDKLHAAGIFGKGAVVAVVDTGTAYDHPDVRFCPP